MFPKNPTKDKNKNDTKLVIRIPCPQRAEKKDLNEKKFEKFLAIFRKLEIKILCLKHSSKCPCTNNSWKTISKKRTLGDNPVTLTEKCIAISQGRRISIKQKDHGSVTILGIIEGKIFKKVLTNLRASVSLVPLSIYKNLGIGKFIDSRVN